jgi:hypothetical protein
MASFRDIMTRGMVFYDEEYLPECKEFCRLRNIHFLPHIHSHNLCYYYDRKHDNFLKKEIVPMQRVESSHYLYDTNLLDQFRKYDVLFVTEGGRIEGVVHYSDYNRSPVYEDLYKKLYLLEKGLVHLITEFSGLTRGDLLDQLGRKGTPEERPRPLLAKHFHGKSMSLKSILEFVRHFELVKIREADIHKIIAVRNKIAHSDHFVTRSNKEAAKYSMSAFAQLIHGVASIEVALRQTGNRLYFMQETLTGDFSGDVIPLEDYLFK